MRRSVKNLLGASALGAILLVESMVLPGASATPVNLTTTPASPSLKHMGTTTDVFGIAPLIPPFSFAPYPGPTNTTNFKIYLATVATILSQIPTGSQDVPGSVIVNARSSLIAMQASMQAAALAQFDPVAFTAYISGVNFNLSTYLAITNTTLNAYYATVQATARKVYADTLASPGPIPGPTVTVTVMATTTVTATPTPSPTPSPLVSKGGSVIKKTYTCVKTVNGVTTKKVLKSVIVKCPVGYKLLKK